MDKKRLEAFVRLVDLGAFRLAALELNVTQPALSQMIARLEKEIGLKLIDRSTRPITTTKAGQEFYFKSKKVLDAMNEVEELVAKATDARVGRVRVGIVPAMLFAQPTKTVRTFQEQHPEAEINLSSLGTSILIEELNQGSIDVAILLTRPDLPGIESQELYGESYRICLPEGHHLAKQQTVKFSDLRDESIIHSFRSTNPEGYDAIISACTGAGFSPKSLSIYGSFLDHAGMVSAGMGVSFAPVSFEHMRPNNVEYRPLIEPEVGMTITISWFPDRLDSVGRAFVEHCIRECAIPAE